MSNDNQIILVCEPQNVVRSDDLFNSLVLEKIVDSAFILDLESIDEKMNYDKMFVNEEIHVVASNLSFQRIQ